MTTHLTTEPGNMTDVIEMFIKDAIDAYPAVGGVLSSAGIGCVTCSIGTCKIKEVVNFIRQYADTFHHAKEEDILFKYFDTSPVLTVMLNEHETGRRHVQNALAALERNDIPGILEALTAYGLLLTEHIRKEDEILYPWMNRELTDSQVGQLFSKFNAVNEQFKTRVEQNLALVAKLEKAAEQRS